eukprot:TRINITY_DN17733_c0_g1_i1.p1 TRINITY_DN17733_c0_g1~~TRINITY_DN17733_c0_g1_i1.p1  ORF type:complete len:118 (+),score=16.55 TRINITY_DN17733_c0_g1_i1:229-582(+)
MTQHKAKIRIRQLPLIELITHHAAACGADENAKPQMAIYTLIDAKLEQDLQHSLGCSESHNVQSKQPILKPNRALLPHTFPIPHILQCLFLLILPLASFALTTHAVMSSSFPAAAAR